MPVSTRSRSGSWGEAGGEERWPAEALAVEARYAQADWVAWARRSSRRPETGAPRSVRQSCDVADALNSRHMPGSTCTWLDAWQISPDSAFGLEAANVSELLQSICEVCESTGDSHVRITSTRHAQVQRSPSASDPQSIAHSRPPSGVAKQMADTDALTRPQSRRPRFTQLLEGGGWADTSGRHIVSIAARRSQRVMRRIGYALKYEVCGLGA